MEKESKHTYVLNTHASATAKILFLQRETRSHGPISVLHNGPRAFSLFLLISFMLKNALQVFLKASVGVFPCPSPPIDLLPIPTAKQL